jgi:hypothetical protein
LDGTFASEIARLLGPQSALQFAKANADEAEQSLFANRYTLAKRRYLSGEEGRSGLREDRITANRDLQRGNRPKYLDLLQCEAPPWARESVMPYRRGSFAARVSAELKRSAASNPELEKVLQNVEETIRQLTPVAEQRSMQETPKFRRGDQKSYVDRPDGRVPFAGVDQVIAAEVERLIVDLTNLKVSRGSAYKHCWNTYRKIHHDQLEAIRQIHNKGWRGPAGSKPLSRAVVNRVFCSDRSARISDYGFCKPGDNVS